MSKVERFTKRSRSVLSHSQDNAVEYDHAVIDVPHLLLGLWQEVDGVAGRVMRRVGINGAELLALVEKAEYPSLATVESPELSDPVKRVLELSVDQARKWNHHYIGTEHLLVGIIRLRHADTKPIFDRVGLTIQVITDYLIQPDVVKSPLTASSGTVHPLLDYMSKDQITPLTQLVFDLARHHAKRAGRAEMNAFDLCFAIWQLRVSLAGRLLRETGLKFEHFAPAYPPQPPPSSPKALSDPPFDFQKMLDRAMDEGYRRRSHNITPEYVLLALLNEPFVLRLFQDSGAKVDDTIRRLAWQLRGGNPDDLPEIKPRSAFVERLASWLYRIFEADILKNYPPRNVMPQPDAPTVQEYIDNISEQITYSPQDIFLYQLRAKYHEDAGQHKQAAADYGRAADLDPAADELRFKSGVSLLQAREFASALAQFASLVEKNPQNAVYLRYRGYLKVLTGDLGGSFADLDAACQLDSADADNFAMRGYARLLNREIERALEDCKVALELNVVNPIGRYLSACIALEQGDLVKARREFNRGSLDHLGYAQAGKALLYLREGHEALKAADRALELDEHSEMAYYVRGKVYIARGERERAAAEFKTALEYWTIPDTPFYKPLIDEMRAYLADQGQSD